jgi:hypothetical protein
VGGQHGCRFILAQGAVGLHFVCAVLHVTFFYKCDVVGPLIRDVLYAQDIFEFITQATVQGSTLHGIVLIEVHD